MLELHVENGGLKVIESRVESPCDNKSVFIASMIAEKRHLPRHRRIIRRQTAAVAETSEHFRRIEAELRGDPKRAGVSALELRPQRLSRVLDDCETVTIGDCLEGVHIACPTIELNRHDG